MYSSTHLLMYSSTQSTHISMYIYNCTDNFRFDYKASRVRFAG